MRCFRSARPPWHAAAVAAAIECASCGAPVPAAGVACGYCGAVAQAPPPPPVPPAETFGGGAWGAAQEAVPANLPPAFEARRIRGLAVPLVAAAVVLGIGLPLTALAVSQVGRLPATGDLLPSPGPEAADPGATAPAVPGARGRGQLRLSGAVTYEGAATPVGCTGGPPKLATFERGAERFSILVNPPAVAPGVYQLGTATATFVAVTKVAGGSQTWTSLGRGGARGSITIGANNVVLAQFSGLEGSGGGAEGTIEGVVELACA